MPTVRLPHQLPLFGVSVVLMLLLAPRGQAQTYTWTGATSSNWSTASNWDLGTVPVPNADLIFGAPGLVNLPTNNLNASQPRSMTFNNNLGAALTVSGQGLGIGAGGITQTSSSLVTLDFNLQVATSQTWTTSGGGGLTIRTLTINSIDTNTLLGTSGTQASGAFTLTGDASGLGFANINTQSGRSTTLWHNITLSASQSWTSTNSNARTVVNSNLTAAPGVTLTLTDSNGAAPNFQFGGTNSAFLGDLTTSTASGAVILNTPSAMIAGRVLINADSRYFGITGALGANTPPTYTFDYAAGAAPAAPGHGRGIVVFAGNGPGGLYATGTARWDPGAGADYLTPTTAGANIIDLASPGGSFFFPGGTIRFGTASTNFVLRSDFTVHGGSGTLQSPLLFDYALSDDGTTRNFTTSAALTILTRPRAATNVTGSANLGGATTIAAGLLSINGADRLFTGNLALTGGTLVFDGMSWASFAAVRAPGVGANQYQLVAGGFAARGNTVTINGTSTTPSSFDRDFSLGSATNWIPDGNSELYANAGVTIARNTVLTDRRTISVYSEGPGLSGAAGMGFVHGLTGGFSDDGVTRGALVVRASANAFFQNAVSELVLGGTNNWTGSSHTVVNGWHLNSGPGGLIVGDSTLLVRFANPAALPTGNAGQPAFLAAVRNNPTFTNNSGLTGFLFTGTPGGQTYTLPAGMRILLGGAGLGGNPLGGILGSTGGSATLASAPVFINMPNPVGNATSLNVLVRDGTFTLGTGSGTSGAVSFAATTNGAAGSDTGITGGASPLLDRSNGFTTLVKSGPGLLVLQNVRYTDIAGTGPYAGGLGGQSLTWSVSSGIVRDNAADLANFGPAAITLFTTIEGHGAMNRDLGFTANTLDWTDGGFAAVGGPLTLNVGGAAAPLTWGANRFMSAISFAATLTLGSANADNVVTLVNPIDLGNSSRTVEVLDNPSSAADYAVITGNLTSASFSSNLVKVGAGRLDLQGANNTYNGRTTISAGRLNVNGTLAAGGGGVTAQTAGTLGGTGTISRPVTILSGGTLNPGAATPGTLTINSGVVFEPGAVPATFAARLAGPASADQLVVNAGSVFLSSTTLSIDLGYAPNPADRFFLIVNNGANPIGGTFTGPGDGQPRTFVFNGTSYTGWLYYGADFDTNQLTGGNDLAISFSPVPEPAGMLGIALAAIVTGSILRRRV